MAMKIAYSLKIFVSTESEMWAGKSYRWLKEENAEEKHVKKKRGEKHIIL